MHGPPTGDRKPLSFGLGAAGKKKMMINNRLKPLESQGAIERQVREICPLGVADPIRSHGRRTAFKFFRGIRKGSDALPSGAPEAADVRPARARSGSKVRQ